MHTALKSLASFRRGDEGGGVGTLILIYISRFGAFLEFQNFECHFLVGGGGQKINMFGYDEIMVIFGAFWGVISIHLGFFLRSRYRF